MRLDGALSYILKTSEKVQTALEAYRALQAIEGPHKRSISVQAMLIKNVYAKLDQTDLMYQVGSFFFRLVGLLLKSCLLLGGNAGEFHGLFRGRYGATFLQLATLRIQG